MGRTYKGTICLLFMGLFIGAPVIASSPATAAEEAKQRIALTAEERRWITEHPEVRVALDPMYPPVESLDKNSKLVGMSADYLEILEQLTGLRFVIVPPRNWDHAVAMAKRRDIDMLSAATETEQRSTYMYFASPHIVLPGAIISRTGGERYTSLYSLQNKTVGVVSGYVWQEWIAEDYPDIKIRPVSSMEEGLKLASFGQIDAMIANLATATNSIRNLTITNLHVSGETEYSANLSFASRKDWPVLASILQKAIAAITPQERGAIQDRYISLTRESGRVEGTVLYVLLGSTGFVVFVIIATIFWNYSLRRMVHRQNEALRESREQYRTIVENQSDVIAQLTPHSLLLSFVNESYCALYGLPREQLIGSRFLDFVLEKDREPVRQKLAALTPEQPSVEMENRIETADGSVLWMFWSNLAIFDDTGNVIEIQAVGRDITERRQVEEALLAAKDEAELASRSKSEFLANMSHELRTPLNAIIGFSEMIAGEHLGPHANKKYRDYGEDIVSSGNHLLGLIADILDVTRIETGTADFDPDSLNLRDVVDTAVLMTCDRAEAGNIKLECHLPEPQILPFHGDRRRLIQILVNLISNAVKFTPNGGKVLLEIDHDVDGGYFIRVIDTGIGISEEDIPRIFERFGQVHNVEIRSIEGVGLGLPLTKTLVEMHNGTISIDSDVGIGTTVTVWFPSERIAQSA